MDLIPTSDPCYPFVSADPERLGGTPVFRGTRVPVKTLFDYLKGGETLDEFLEQFEGVGRDQAVAVIELAQRGLLDHLPPRARAA
ncbi:MAG: DUF433 domain-containing protein [Phycisphaerales bacterium]